MKLIEEIKLDNGLILKIFDLSRVIAADTVKVELFFQTTISLETSLFEEHHDYLQVKNARGDKLSYEHRLERSFVPRENETSTRDELINTFKNNSLNYLSSVHFPRKMALSALREIKKNPYKYPSRVDADTED